MTITQRYGGKETKLYLTNPSATSVGLSPTRIALLSTIAQGSDIVNRIGRRIRVKCIRWRGTLLGAQTNSVADDPYNAMRVTLIRCLPGTTFTSYTVNNAIDPRFNTSAGLLETMYDKTAVVSVFGKDSTGYVAVAQQWEFVVHCDVMIEYGATGASTPINQELVLYMVSDSGAVVNPGFASSSTIAVEFVDDA